ncbi:hypothetical protein U729_3153 (plasmid) [Clostridium baratii str. Sullivan]|uniref:Uncharacterized protein n=1 Tax=Clostridium baratii str. Sullivan TaxID=1415775 RepID=A0A0A7G0A5_9CLOT|nr:hypothetical protein [Clostridium baratii]AIY85267.1 hypothetical protein U729_3153 [Clostridium baratii str. Sullivan]
MEISVHDLLYDLKKKQCKDYRLFATKILFLLEIGYTGEDILEMLNSDNYIDEINKHLEIEKQSEVEYNLLQEVGTIYYHNELKISTPPVLINYDINTGELIKVEEEYFLEMKASYCIKDLFNYIKTKNCFYDLDNENTVIGSLKWLLKNYNLEIILYMIDTANDIIQVQNKKRIKIIDIKNYYEEAIEARNRKKSELIINGADKIVPRKRK